MQLIEQVKAARRVNTPILAIQSSDQPACQTAIATALNGGAVVFAWDPVRGLRAANEPAAEWIKGFGEPKEIAANTGNPNACLDFAQNLPERSVLFQTNADLFWNDPVTSTAVLNLRETFKANKRTLIGTGSGFSLPAALQSSVVLIDEALPTDEKILAVLDALYTGINRNRASKGKPALPALAEDQRREAVTAVRGLSAFLAEQTFAESIDPESGLNLPECWNRKRIAFNQIDGLTLEESNGPTFDDIRGLSQILKRETAHFAGAGAAAVIVRIEEIEKALAGSQSDSSGTGQASLGYILDFMQENRCTGFVALGPGGSGKSLVSKALGRQFKRPVVIFDVKATEDKFVGESGRKIRNALKALKGLAGGLPILFVATCNRLESLPPELKRRFKQGLWFFDLPTESEREAIWKLYLGKFGLKGYKAATLAAKWANWTGAEIFNACETASDEGISIDAAAEFVVPVAEADPEALRKLRDLAHDRFLSASAVGKYTKPGTVAAPAANGGRDLGDD
jgi:SpoVK/Ycf46/Vps4 family AAA+-type ATPase